MIDNEIDEMDDLDGEDAPPPVEAPVAPVDPAPIDAAPIADEPVGPPFVLETWVLDAIEAMVFASNEPLTPSRAREVIAAEMELMDNVEGKGLPTVSDMKRAFRTLLERWGTLAMRDVPPPPPPARATTEELAPLLEEKATATTKLDGAALEAAMQEAASNAEAQHPDALAEPLLDEAAATVKLDAAALEAAMAAPDVALELVPGEPATEVSPAPPALPAPPAPPAPLAPDVDTSSVRGFRLVEIDGALTFRTSAQQARFIRRMQMGKPQRLSRASLETLAVIAYRQPVTKPQVEEVRGVDSSGAIKMLLDKKLIRILGKAEEIGRPLLYGTTKTFLEFFELQSLNDLPTLKELHELEHGIDPNAVDIKDDRPAVIMDLFNADHVSAVSEETERESNEAMEALEKALGEAKDVAKRASTLVFGMQVEDGDDKPVSGTGVPPVTAAPAAVAEENGNGNGSGAPPEQTAEAVEKKDEEPKS